MSSQTVVIKKVEMDIELFEDLYHFLSAMKMFPEMWKHMSLDKHKSLMERLEPAYEQLNP